MNNLNKIGLAVTAMILGSASANDSYALTTTAAVIPPSCTQTLRKTGTISGFYDPETQLVNLVAELDDNSYAGWGWGASME